MSALPGGSAAKLGDRYEDWWTLCRIADVLRGDAARIRLEPPATEGIGIEFWVEDGTTRWCEQAKDAAARGSWTIERLKTEGVLASVVHHLADGHRVRIVLSTQAKDFAALASHATQAITMDEFRNVLTIPQSAGLTTVAAVWNVDEQQAWQYLKNVTVEHLPADHLRRLVHLTYERLVQGDTAAAVHALRGWLDDHLQEILTANDIWTFLAGAGFPRRLLAGDENVLGALSATVDRQRTRVEALLPSIGKVDQPHTSRLVELLTADDHRQVIVVDGRAGSGKSTVASAAVRELTDRGWYAAVVRLDAVDQRTQTALALGKDAALSDSPAILLDGVAAGSPAVLLIDQLDAVSTYSGRMPDSFAAVTEVLEQLEQMCTVKVALVVRTVDLNEDPRMRRLLADTDRVTRLSITDLDPADVRATLAAAGVDTGAVRPETLLLLCVPLHLSVFSRLSAQAQITTFRTLSELYRQYANEIRADIERQVGHLDWAGITSTLVDYMSEHEVLRAPRAILDRFPVAEVNALLSANVLVADDNQVGFFHETFFDFLFAQAFIATGRDLHDFLVDSGQHLFRRAQMRQVLEYLAGTDRAAFRHVVGLLLESEHIRPHLKAVVVALLRQLDATADDWLAIESLAFGGSPLGDRLVPLLSSPVWFDAVDAAGRWESLLADHATVDQAANQLIWAARDRPERVQTLVQPYIGESETWRQRLRALVSWSLTPPLIDFAVELLERGDLDDARGPIAVNSDFFSIVYGVHDEEPSGAARLIGAHLRRAIARAIEDGSSDPFTSGHLSDHSSGGAEVITTVAERAPREYLDEVLPSVVALSEATAKSHGDEWLRAGRWGYRHQGVRYGVDDAIFGGVEDALRALATTDPDAVLELARSLAASDIDELRFLACRAFTALQSGDEAVDWLLSDDRNLRLGWSDSPRWASRELIGVATKSCGDDRLDALRGHLLDHYPAYECLRERRELRGRSQYDLLSGVEPARRDVAVTRRLGELDRKFAEAPQAPQEMGMADFVRSPIDDDSSQKMSDANWLSALAKHTGDDNDWTTGVGGARELAQVMGNRAAEDPERFARLALQFGESTPPVYFARVIEAIAGKVELSLLRDVCEHANELAGTAVRRSIAWALRAVPADDTRVVALLRECAHDIDPDHESARTKASSGEYFYGGDLLSAGLNSTRGGTAGAIAGILFAGSSAIDELAAIVSDLARDPIMGVRAYAAEAVRALFKYRADTALEFADALMTDVDIELFGTPTVTQLLIASFVRDQERFAPHVGRALAGADEVARHGGQVWAVALIRDLVRSPLPTDVSELSPAARRGAAEVLAANPTSSREALAWLLDDEDDEVRGAAARAASDLRELPLTEAETLLSTILGAAAFTEHYAEVVAALERRNDVLPESTIIACERAVVAGGGALGDIRRGDAAAAEDIVALTLRLYRQGDDAMRRRCLDVIDQLTERRAFGLEDKLDAVR
jgi:hypothetical protein